MNELKTHLLLYLLLLVSTAYTQDKLPIPRNVAEAYEKGTRTREGIPGKDYWQNTADYDLQVNLNPTDLLLRGIETIVYTNNSPDTLFDIVFKLYPNIFKKGAQRDVELPAEDVNEGMTIDGLSVTGTPVITYSIDGTNMKVSIPPMLPRTSLEFNIKYHYKLNKGAGMRTGQVEPNVSFLAYFFPRIAVYDDVDGWNRNQYTGTQEFYNDFCTFKAAITVPKGFIVWATGDLKNCAEVLSESFCKRMKLAEASDTVVNIIAEADLANGGITSDNPLNTWRFEASNVPDFAFATTDHYVWKSASLVVDSSTGRRTRADAVYNPKHRDYEEVIHYNLKTLKAMSFRFPKWPYPYSHETVFDGLDQMEYPMMVNDNPTSTAFDAITLTDHEVFHTMFPFYMGINETKYSWMDEGWATIAEWLISPMIDTTIVDTYGLSSYEAAAGKEVDLPISTISTQINGTTYFLNSYVKPALAYLYVKDLLGDELFTKALHYYIRQWNGKHPIPSDFFNCINKGSGKDLDWFWRRWFFETGSPDLSIAKVKRRGKKYEVTIKAKGNKPTPVDLQILLDDNTVKKEHRSIGVWENGNDPITLSFTTDREVTKITLGSTYTVDVDKSDNTWTPQ